MKTLINLLNETLLLEKIIAQIKSNIQFNYKIDYYEKVQYGK